MFRAPRPLSFSGTSFRPTPFLTLTPKLPSFQPVQQVRWATKKATSGSKNGRDSNPKYRGIKKWNGSFVIPGNIIVRQKGTKVHPGNNVSVGKDFTLFATASGFVRFQTKTHLKKGGRPRKFVEVVPSRREWHRLQEILYKAKMNKGKFRDIIRTEDVARLSSTKEVQQWATATVKVDRWRPWTPASKTVEQSSVKSSL